MGEICRASNSIDADADTSINKPCKAAKCAHLHASASLEKCCCCLCFSLWHLTRYLHKSTTLDPLRPEGWYFLGVEGACLGVVDFEEDDDDAYFQVFLIMKIIRQTKFRCLPC